MRLGMPQRVVMCRHAADGGTTDVAHNVVVGATGHVHAVGDAGATKRAAENPKEDATKNANVADDAAERMLLRLPLRMPT